MWALGVTLYEMCALKMPFDANSLKSLINRIERGLYDPLPPHYSKELKELVKRCLTVKTNLRVDLRQIFLAPFIQKHIESNT